MLPNSCENCNYIFKNIKWHIIDLHEESHDGREDSNMRNRPTTFPNEEKIPRDPLPIKIKSTMIWKAPKNRFHGGLEFVLQKKRTIPLIIESHIKPQFATDEKGQLFISVTIIYPHTKGSWGILLPCGEGGGWVANLCMVAAGRSTAPCALFSH